MLHVAYVKVSKQYLMNITHSQYLKISIKIIIISIKIGALDTLCLTVCEQACR